MEKGETHLTSSPEQGKLWLLATYSYSGVQQAQGSVQSIQRMLRRRLLLTTDYWLPLYSPRGSLRWANYARG